MPKSGIPTYYGNLEISIQSPKATKSLRAEAHKLFMCAVPSVLSYEVQVVNFRVSPRFDPRSSACSDLKSEQ